VCCAVLYNATDPRERQTRREAGTQSHGPPSLSTGGSQATERSTIENTSKPFVEAIKRTYKRFLKLPAIVVLAVLWLAGAVLIGACALALYLLTP
jgi:hypothetical protein